MKLRAAGVGSDAAGLVGAGDLERVVAVRQVADGVGLSVTGVPRIRSPAPDQPAPVRGEPRRREERERHRPRRSIAGRPRPRHDRGVDRRRLERGELGAKRGDRPRGVRRTDEVLQLVRVLLEIEQLATAVVVLHVLVARRHDASERSGSRLVREEGEPGARRRSLAHPLAVLDQQGRARAARGAVHEREERSAVRVPREPGQFGDGGRDVDVRHQRAGRGRLARVEEGRVAHDHRNTHGLLVRVGLAEPAMFAEQEPVVRQVDHDRVAGAIAQAVEDVADTVIQRADRMRHLREAAVGVVDLVARERAPSRVQAGSSR